MDPKTLIEPLEVKIKLELDADTEILEYVCNENEKDRHHTVGKVSDFQKNQVAREILARYAGTYVFGPNQWNTLGPTVKISLENGRLMFESRVGKQPMRPLSETRFVAQFDYVEFATDASCLTATLPEDDFKAERQR
jgi:hypothetical protein